MSTQRNNPTVYQVSDKLNTKLSLIPRKSLQSTEFSGTLQKRQKSSKSNWSNFYKQGLSSHPVHLWCRNSLRTQEGWRPSHVRWLPTSKQDDEKGSIPHSKHWRASGHLQWCEVFYQTRPPIGLQSNQAQRWRCTEDCLQHQVWQLSVQSYAIWAMQRTSNLPTNHESLLQPY